MNLLQELRKKQGLTQMDVEVATGIDTATLSLYENGVRYPTVKNAQKLGDLYKVEWSKFFEEEL